MEKANSLNTISTNDRLITQNNEFISTYTDFLSSIKSINKTDTSTLRNTFGSIKDLTHAKKEELNLCPGLGALKINRLYDIFNTSFELKKL